MGDDHDDRKIAGSPRLPLADGDETWFDAQDLALRSTVTRSLREAELAWHAPLDELSSNQIQDEQAAIEVDLRAVVEQFWRASGAPLRGEMAWINCAGDPWLRLDVSGILAETLAWPHDKPVDHVNVGMVVQVSAGPWGWARRLDRWSTRWRCERAVHHPTMMAKMTAQTIGADPVEHPWSARLRIARSRGVEAPWIDALRGYLGDGDAQAVVVMDCAGKSGSRGRLELRRWHELAMREGWIVMIVGDDQPPSASLGRELVGVAHVQESTPTSVASERRLNLCGNSLGVADARDHSLIWDRRRGLIKMAT